MASSSRSYQLQTTYHKSTQEFNCFKEDKVSKALQEEEEEEKSKEEDWLKLGLGLGSIKHYSSSQTLFWPQIRLGLGFEDKRSCLESRKGKEGLEGLNCYDHHHNNDNINGMVLWPSSSLSSCQILNPRGEVAMSIPIDSHHYLAGNNHSQSGLWFTLRSFTNRSGEALPQISKEYIRVK